MKQHAQPVPGHDEARRCRDAKMGGMLIGGLLGAVAGVHIISNTRPVLGISLGVVSVEDVLIPILTAGVGFFGGMFFGKVVGCYER
jgi:hypothetical protein